MTFEAAMEALTADAVRWDTTAGVLGGAADSTGGLAASPSQFSFAGGTVASLYEETRASVERLLRGGESETAGAAVALRKVRETYEGTDQAARDRLAGTWDWS